MEVARIKERLVSTYEKNPFIHLLQMDIVEAAPGWAKLTMPIIHEIHTNLYGIAHGGALASLADTAMGVACVSLGKKVVTLEMNINFLHGAPVNSTVRAISTVVHGGSRTMVVECEVLGQDDTLLAKARGTFFIVGQFEGD